MNAPFNAGTSVKLISIGDEVGVILTEDVLAHLGVRQGDSVDAEVIDGRLVLRRPLPTREEKMQIATRIMDEDQEILRVLAK